MALLRRKVADPAGDVSSGTDRAVVLPAAAESVVEPLGVPGWSGDAADPAAVAEAARGRAAGARERAASLLADALAEAQRIVAGAEAAAREFEDEARAADAEAAERQQVADRAAAIVQAEAELATVEAARDRLAAEAAGLGEVVAAATARLGDLAGQDAEAEQRQRQAVASADVAAVAAAMTSRAAIAEVQAAESARLASARARLEQVRAGLGEADEAIGAVKAGLEELRREAAGLPAKSEIEQVALGLLDSTVAAMIRDQPDKLTKLMLASVPEQARAGMAELLSLSTVNWGGTLKVARAALIRAGVLAVHVAQAEALAAEDPDRFAALAAEARRMRDLEGATVPDPVSALEPGFAVGDDGSLTYLGRVASLNGGGI